MRLPTLALATLGLLNLVHADDARLGPLKDLNGYFPFPPRNPSKNGSRAVTLSNAS